MADDRVPDVDRGPTRPLTERGARLVARASTVDRRQRFAARFEAVQAAEARRRRVQRLVDRIVTVALLVGAPLLGAWVVGVFGRPAGTGVAVGVVVGVVAVVLRRRLERYATDRGATAWDWQRRRHVVRGDPSRAVQHREEPRRRR